MKQEMSKEVQTKPTPLPPQVHQVDVDEFFDEEVVTDVNDTVIPRLLLMQGTSVLVGQEKATQGEIVDSVTAQMLGNSKHPIEVIPIKQLDKEWVIERFVQVGKAGKFEYERVDPWDESLSSQLEFEEDGDRMRRNARLSFYVLLAKDAEGLHLPYLVSFQRTGYSAGRNIASFFRESLLAYKKGDKKAIPMAQVFELGCRIEQGDMGPYYVMETRRSRVAKEVECEKAKFWFSQLRTKTYKVAPEEKAAEAVTEKRDF